MPAGFVRFCLSDKRDQQPDGPDWLHEVKYDGYRIIGRREGGRVTLWTRQVRRAPSDSGGSPPVSWRSRANASWSTAKPLSSARLDCTTSKPCAAAAILLAFDLVKWEGEDLRGRSIEERRGMLEALLDPAPDGLRYSTWFDQPGDVVLRHACAHGLEGIVSKRIGSRYASGRRTWVKVLCPGYRR